MFAWLRGVGPLDRLGVRLILLLGLALLPIGLIAMTQTARVLGEANTRIEAALLGETQSATANLRETVARSRGIVDSLAIAIPYLLNNPDACTTRMKQIVVDTPSITFASYTDMDGILRCSVEGQGTDQSDSSAFREYIKDPKPLTSVSLRAKFSKRPIILLTTPVKDGDRQMGFASVSIDYGSVPIELNQVSQVAPLDTLTFDSSGTPLTSSLGLENALMRLPIQFALSAYGHRRPIVFRDTDGEGVTRIFTIVPLVRGQLSTMAIWPVTAGSIATWPVLSTLALPILMWLASLAVAYFAVHQLVIRHIRRLRRNIRTFAATRRIYRLEENIGIPAELREVTDAFQQMTEQILRDEADQENMLHEKDVLLKEVHHRVKNNLQLIASIANMQIRKSRHPESKFVLRRLQDRVMGLATVHRNLYQASVLSEVRADVLVADLARQLAKSSVIPGGSIRFTLETDPVLLYPDQAVPLSLLVTEALTNAFKYLGKPATGDPWVTLSLHAANSEDPRSEVVLRVRNSKGPFVTEQEEQGASGLGTQLIRAFVMQLDGHTDIIESETEYEVRMSFVPVDFTAEDA